MSILKFFTVKPEAPSTPKRSSCSKDHQMFKPFTVKEGMILAPIRRRHPLTKEQIEDFDSQTRTSTENSRLYLEELQEGVHRPRVGNRAVFTEPDVVVLTSGESGDGKQRRKKLLQFHDNRRPSKYGFWTKVSRKVSGRRPFTMDESIFNYEVDSDDEWEDEGEGDDCKSDEDDEEVDGDNTMNDEEKAFFVDHGYLSTSENGSDEEELDPDARRERSKVKMVTFEAAMESRKKKQMRLLAVGPFWPGTSTDVAVEREWSKASSDFSTFIMSTTRPVPTSFTPGIEKSTPLRALSSKTPTSEKKTSVKRKMLDKEEKELKRGALSLS